MPERFLVDVRELLQLLVARVEQLEELLRPLLLEIKELLTREVRALTNLPRRDVVLLFLDPDLCNKLFVVCV